MMSSFSIYAVHHFKCKMRTTPTEYLTGTTHTRVNFYLNISSINIQCEPQRENLAPRSKGAIKRHSHIHATSIYTP